MSTIPTKLETLEDFKKTCDEFLVPFIEERSKRLAATTKALHDKLETGKIRQDEILLYMNEISEATAFASPKNPMAPYMQNIINLEIALIENGELDYET